MSGYHIIHRCIHRSFFARKFRPGYNLLRLGSTLSGGVRQDIDRIIRLRPENESQQKHGGCGGKSGKDFHHPAAMLLPGKSGRQAIPVKGSGNVLPQPLGLRAVIIPHLRSQVLYPVFLHCVPFCVPFIMCRSGYMSCFFLYSLIFEASRAFALWNWEADVLSVIPNIAAISLWLFSSKTYRLNTVL